MGVWPQIARDDRFHSLLHDVLSSLDSRAAGCRHGWVRDHIKGKRIAVYEDECLTTAKDRAHQRAQVLSSGCHSNLHRHYLMMLWVRWVYPATSY